MIKIYFFVKNLFQSKFIKWIMNEGKFNFPLYVMLIVVPSCLLVFIYYEEILIKNYFKTIFMLVFVFPFVFHYLFSKIFAINQNLVIFFGFIIVLIYSLLFLFIIQLKKTPETFIPRVLILFSVCFQSVLVGEVYYIHTHITPILTYLRSSLKSSLRKLFNQKVSRKIRLLILQLTKV